MKHFTWHEYCSLTEDEQKAFKGFVKWNGSNTIQHMENGVISKLDGPAIIYYDGYKQYFVHGTEYTKEQFETLQDFMKYKNL